MTERLGELILIAPFALALVGFVVFGVVALVRRGRRGSRGGMAIQVIAKPGYEIPKGEILGFEPADGFVWRAKKRAVVGPTGNVLVRVRRDYARRR